MEGLLLALTFMLQVLGSTHMITLCFNSKGWICLRISAFILGPHRHGSDIPQVKQIRRFHQLKLGEL